MPTSYKDLIITPNRASATDSPNISFRSGNTATNTEITLRVYPESNGTLSFEGNAGQLFSITNDLTGSIFSVNDVSGIPSIEVYANGVVELARYNGNVRLGNLAMTYETSNNTVIYSGNVVYTSNIVDLPTQTITASTSFSENSAGKIIVVNNGSSDVTLTFAAAATSGFATSVFRKGTGNVTIAAGAGVTKINSASFISGNIAIANASATVVYSATNEIILLGDIQTNGITGPQGIAGSQGVQGLQGFGGSSGGSGSQGAQGVQGTQGVQGSQGRQGPQGTQGVSIQGAQGTQGVSIQGVQGAQGTQGVSIQGVQGTQGNGAQGTQGVSIQGTQGVQGTQGTLGSQGAQGVQGLTGPTGNNITVTDTRAGTTTPESFANPRFAVDFKQLSSESLTDAGTYFGEISFRPYGSTTDWTGGPAHQLGFPQSGNVWHRWGSSTTWGSWTRMLDTTDFSRGMTLTGPLSVSANVTATSNIFDLPVLTITTSSTVADNAAGKIIVVNNGTSDVTLTFATALTSGFATSIFRKGTGNVTIATGAGVSKINSASFISGNIAISNATATVVYSATNEILLLGDIQTNGITGPQGIQGIQGTQGLQGFSGNGTQGAQGSQGTVGSQGAQGVQGNVGQGIQGTQGMQGTIGSQGAQGVQGTQGLSNQGVQGTQGSQGRQGPQGTVGSQGAQGVQGNVGQGVQGTQGSQGTIGSQGAQGVQGNVGQGVQGTQGMQGTIGSQGAQGVQGVQGTIGSQGVQGVQGTIGSQGVQGVQGTIGSQGLQGSQGVQGNVGQGVQGTQGVQGSQGRQGPQGTVGSQGAQGVQGVQGNVGQGVQGTQGLAGTVQGSQGVQGNVGQGVQGTQGVQGSQGRQGPQGTVGSQGAQGVQGLQGLSNQGVQGTQGSQGRQGTQGVQGVIGAQGTTVVPRSATTTTLVIGDVGKCVDATAGITVPNAVFSAGDIVSIYANVAAGITITQGTSLSLRLAGSTSSGNRTLAGNGICTIWFSNSSCGIISGAGLT